MFDVKKTLNTYGLCFRVENISFKFQKWIGAKICFIMFLFSFWQIHKLILNTNNPIYSKNEVVYVCLSICGSITQILQNRFKRNVVEKLYIHL